MFPVVNVPGLAYICTMCEHMSNSVDKKLTDCGHSSCSGPSVGKTFPDYKGPLSQILCEYCFRCGDPSEKILELDSAHRLGVCSECLEKVLDNLNRRE